jgi:hypothetical protein
MARALAALRSDLHIARESQQESQR